MIDSRRAHLCAWALIAVAACQAYASNVPVFQAPPVATLNLASSVEGSEAAQALAEKGKNDAVILRKSVSKTLRKSEEEVKTLKSLLTTNAQASSSMNELLAEMGTLTKRLSKFQTSMDECRVQLEAAQAEKTQVLTPEQVDDPVLGATTLLQLEQNAQTFSHKVRALGHALKSLPEHQQASML
eukprot:gnl/TRDRNA2_/TRDRNA2_183303_c0_seq1.p2 gnl/TRDRNA2_/TRDRNA2_183303_c0~~gnl/TRDRNA2_/TRDRNA2_183303_c0_seq1.p2  ORF type:complete len:184 (+),score=40.57 gnl/TRDRNA2_/TRDRNA2_183303_c0_seq1:129-680(+)